MFLNAEPIKEAAVSIGRVDYCKRQQKWVCDQMSKEDLSVACVGIMKPIIAKDVAAKQKEHLPKLACEHCVFVGSEKSWGQGIIEDQLFIMMDIPGCCPYAMGGWGLQVGDLGRVGGVRLALLCLPGVHLPAEAHLHD